MKTVDALAMYAPNGAVQLRIFKIRMTGRPHRPNVSRVIVTRINTIGDDFDETARRRQATEQGMGWAADEAVDTLLADLRTARRTEAWALSADTPG
ncbi:hypothetical protein [Haladaptatus sp. NG-WS-4]